MTTQIKIPDDASQISESELEKRAGLEATLEDAEEVNSEDQPEDLELWRLNHPLGYVWSTEPF
jgi:hypothetical protein